MCSLPGSCSFTLSEPRIFGKDGTDFTLKRLMLHKPMKADESEAVSSALIIHSDHEICISVLSHTFETP